MKYGWIKDIPDFIKYFTPDLQQQIELIGFENFMTIYEVFAKTTVLYSTKPIQELQKQWAINNPHVHYAEAARILGVSEKTIYKWRQNNNTDNLDLFEEEK